MGIYVHGKTIHKKNLLESRSGGYIYFPLLFFLNNKLHVFLTEQVYNFVKIAQQGRNTSRFYIIIYLDFRLVVSVTSLIVMLSCIKVFKQHDFHCVHYHVLFMKGGHVYSFCC